MKHVAENSETVEEWTMGSVKDPSIAIGEIGKKATAAARLRSELGHPVVDADAHFIESMPVFLPFFDQYVTENAGADVLKRFKASGVIEGRTTEVWQNMPVEKRESAWLGKATFWAFPTSATLDRATAHLPRLMYRRLDDLGIDFAVVYPSTHLLVNLLPDAELRQVACRAINAFNMHLLGPYRDRMTPVAVLPSHTPEEAIAELEHAVIELGFKAAIFNGSVVRPIGDTGASRVDGLGLDSAYDYDPFWRRCIELGVSPANHAPSIGMGTHNSISNFQFNHIGNHATAKTYTTKSLWMGGVTHRFPQIAFGMLEGGVGWACSLYADFFEHWEKRNAAKITELDPANLDPAIMTELFEAYGDDVIGRDASEVIKWIQTVEPRPEVLDEFAAMGLTDKASIADSFIPHFYFGCEADDRMVAAAFNEKLNPLGVKLRAMFSSDIGHWDVSDMTHVLPEAYELCEDGLLTPEDFKDFVFTNAVRFYSTTNPNFFKGTRVELETDEIIRERATPAKSSS
jgi:predicted TIM-barrel fold metal-dependent hydrolase